MSQFPNFQQPPQQTIIVNTPRQQQSQALPALVNIFFPGLGQLIQGRVLAAIGFFGLNVVAGILAIATLGVGLVLAFPVWLWCILDAAKYKG